MTISEVIKKAIEGGYDEAKIMQEIYPRQSRQDWNTYFLDPSFWSSLGKAIGLEMEKEYYCEVANCGFEKNYVSHHDYTFCPRDGRKMTLRTRETGAYIRYWHRFIDHLAKGESAESFFKTLT